MSYLSTHAQKPEILEQLQVVSDRIGFSDAAIPAERRPDFSEARTALEAIHLRVSLSPAFLIPQSTADDILRQAQAAAAFLTQFRESQSVELLDEVLKSVAMIVEIAVGLPVVVDEERGLGEAIRRLRRTARTGVTAGQNAQKTLGNEVGALKAAIEVVRNEYATEKEAAVAELLTQLAEVKSEASGATTEVEEYVETKLGQFSAEVATRVEESLAAARIAMNSSMSAVDTRTTEAVAVVDAAIEKANEDRETLEEAVAELEKQLDTVRSAMTETETNDRVDRERRFNDELTKLSDKSKDDTESRRTEFEVLHRALSEDATGLLGRARKVLGTSAASAVYEAFDNEARAQERLANQFRNGAVWTLIITAALVFALFLGEAFQQTHRTYSGFWEVVGNNSSRTILLALLVGGAAYAARQSGHHRKREQAARQLANELAVFFPFVADLPPDQQQALAITFFTRAFRGNIQTDDSPGTHDVPLGGPLGDLVGQLLKRQ